MIVIQTIPSQNPKPSECNLLHSSIPVLFLPTSPSMFTKLMLNPWSMSLCRLYFLSTSRRSKTTFTSLSFFASLTDYDHLHASNPTPKSSVPNALLFNYLIDSFGFPKSRALSFCNSYKEIKSQEKLRPVVDFFESIGFQDADIRSLFRGSPKLLFADIDKILKPKLEFFQELGLSGSDLGKFLSRNKRLLNLSLDRTLRPFVDSLKGIFLNDDMNKLLIQILQRFYWSAGKYSESIFLSNMSFLMSCGITGSKLFSLMLRGPILFMIDESELRGIVSQVLDMGFSTNSPMLGRAIFTVYSMRTETFNRKLDLVRSLGFSAAEVMDMFKRYPLFLLQSEKKLKSDIEFYINTVKLKKVVLVHNPVILTVSTKGRIIPRHKVVQILMSKRLLKKEPSFLSVITMSEKKFVDKFISRFKEDSDELLVAYKTKIVDASEDQ